MDGFTLSDFLALTCPANVAWLGICSDSGKRCVVVRTTSGQTVTWLNNVDAPTAVAARVYVEQRFGVVC